MYKLSIIRDNIKEWLTTENEQELWKRHRALRRLLQQVVQKINRMERDLNKKYEDFD